MAKRKLKPCPMCGGEAKLQQAVQFDHTANKYSAYWVECMKCNISYRQNIRFNRADAIKCWNGERVLERTCRINRKSIEKLTLALRNIADKAIREAEHVKA